MDLEVVFVDVSKIGSDGQEFLSEKAARVVQIDGGNNETRDDIILVM
jgi:hypothetical protein